MIRKRAQLLLLKPVRRARVIAALLLACLAWGATAELNHHHGVRSNSRISQQLDRSETSAAADETTAAQFQSSEQQGPSSKSKTGTDCTICQLHQNLAATLFSHPPRLGTEEATALRAPATVIVEDNEFKPNQRGRAPPSLL